MHDIPLNETQRIFADKNHNLVYKFLHALAKRVTPQQMEIIRLRTKGYQTNEIAQMQNTSLYHVNTLLDNARFIVVELCRDS